DGEVVLSVRSGGNRVPVRVVEVRDAVLVDVQTLLGEVTRVVVPDALGCRRRDRRYVLTALLERDVVDGEVVAHERRAVVPDGDDQVTRGRGGNRPDELHEVAGALA